MEERESPGDAPEKRLLRVLRGEALSPPPVWLMRQAGRYLPEYRAVRAQVRDFLELCYTPELATEVSLQPIRRFGLDGAILFSDILVVPHALGVDVRFVEGEGPRLEPLRTPRDLERLDRGRLRERLRVVYETVERLASEIPPQVTLIGFSGAPWTLAAYMIEGSTSKEYLGARTVARRDPAQFSKLIELLVEAVVDHLCAQIEHGAETVQLFDSWAGVLPAAEAERWVMEPARRIVSELGRRHPEVPVIVFPRGIGPLYPVFAERVPASAIGMDTAVPGGWLRDALGGRQGIAVQGNLDPVCLRVGGDVLRRETERIVATWSGHPHVFNLGHGVLPVTPPEHVAELVSHLHSMGS